jgi:hypothetical protein
MATILPGCFLRKTDKKYFLAIWPRGGSVPKVATSDDHNFSSEFPQKVQFLAI